MPDKTLPPFTSAFHDQAAIRYQEQRIAHWDAVALRRRSWRGWGNAYHKRLEEIYRFLITPGQRVLEIGCGAGNLLASLNPDVGVGVDFSDETLKQAAEHNPDLEYVCADIHDLSRVEGSFDYIILSNIINDLWDVQTVFEQLRRLSSPSTRLVINYFSRLWELPLKIAQKINLAIPSLEQNWLTVEDLSGLLDLAGFEVIRSWQDILFPFPIPGLEQLSNRVLARFWPFRLLAWSNFTIARLHPTKSGDESQYSVSVVVPARNEEGNIEAIFKRVPEMGKGTELIFVEGHSHDNTYQAIEEAIKRHPERKSMLMRQPGIGKADAVRLGYEKASGDILMILDADLTVPPEKLPRFYNALRDGVGEFINGVRLVYPMEEQAMRSLNFLGNKFFSLAFSWLLGQPIKDTLCGTKVLWKKDYEKIAANRAYFGDFDPFGDFDLIFGAAKLNLKIVDLPIRYRERTYGDTNISRWRHGLLLLRMVWFAARRMKFV